MTLLIVDDHDGFRHFVRDMLTEEGFDVAGVAEDGETALTRVDELHPDAVLLDIQLPGIDGFEVARLLAGQPHPPQVVLTSSRQASAYGSRLAQSPVCGFIPKQDVSGEALAALLAS